MLRGHVMHEAVCRIPCSRPCPRKPTVCKKAKEPNPRDIKAPTLHGKSLELLTFFSCPSLPLLLEVCLFLIHCLRGYPRVPVQFHVPKHKAVEPFQKCAANSNIHCHYESLPFPFLLPCLHRGSLKNPERPIFNVFLQLSSPESMIS